MPPRQPHRFAVRHLGDVREPELVELVPHDVHAEPRDQHARLLRDPTQRWVVKVIEMVMREVHVVRLEECLQDRRIRRKVPPRSPVARSRQPRVDENPLRGRFDEETRVANHREPHCARLWHFRLSRRVEPTRSVPRLSGPADRWCRCAAARADRRHRVSTRSGRVVTARAQPRARSSSRLSSL